MMKRVERIEVALSEALALTHLEVLDTYSGNQFCRELKESPLPFLLVVN